MREIKKILFVTLSYVGDVAMTLPALDLLRSCFPSAAVTVLAGKNTVSLFAGNTAIPAFIPFDKYAPLREKVRLFRGLRAADFDLVVDMRNSLFGYLLGRIRMPLIQAPKGAHLWERHFSKTRFLIKEGTPWRKGGSIGFSAEDRDAVTRLLAECGCGERKPVVLVPGSRSEKKRWPGESYRALAVALAGKGFPVLAAGDKSERDITAAVSRGIPGAVDIAGKTTLLQLACLLSRSAALVANDSGIMHLASYLDVPTAAVLGPSDEVASGPWSRFSAAVMPEMGCRPCVNAPCRYGDSRCMRAITPEEALAAVESLVKEASQKKLD